MYYSDTKEKILKELNSSMNGLDNDQVEKNRMDFGENKLYEKKRKSVARVFFEQFKDMLVIILIIAAFISMLTGSPESTIVIMIVLILNSVLGTVQYFKAEKSLDALKNMAAPTASVVREGNKIEIPASDLVVGDIVFLEAGNVVPADCRILEGYSIKVNESALTGESESVEKNHEILEEKKNIPLGDRHNMTFSGSLVVYGRATLIVTAVGQNTELGKIANLMNETEKKETPLQVTMNNFSKKLSIGIMIICIGVFLLDMYRGMSFTDSLLFAVALAVAAIPEALTSIITISLAIGTSRMAEENAIVKELNSVESLGSVSIICSDKTGTLTQNKMTVQDIFYLNPSHKKLLLISSILCNDTKIMEKDLSGDPTETALVSNYFENYDDYYKVLEKYPRKAEIPFDSDRKLMSTVHKMDGRLVMITKGALDVIIERVTNISSFEKERINSLNNQWSQKGLRVLAFAIKDVTDEKIIDLEDEFEMTFVGLINEMDPPRPESKVAVKKCIEAGIKPIMITGDHKVTASSIAKTIGIMKDGDEAITGSELDEISDEELFRKLEHISVYARVSPSNKIRIVKAWQNKGKIVSMTGDGVNDAPALKSADVGIAMGITGTEVSKDASSIILTDDNFATIIKAVLNGRNIYANIKNAIKFLLSGNMAGIFVVLYAVVLALPTPFTAVHLLFINLVTDSLPALAVSMEPMNHQLIHNKPRPKTESILTKSTIIQILIQGILIGFVTVVAFYMGLGDHKGGNIGIYLSHLAGTYGNASIYRAMTMAFATLCLARLWHGFSSRSDSSILKIGLFSNMYTIYAFLVGTALLFGILFVPVIGKIFTVATLSWLQIRWILILAFLPTFVIQLWRIIRGK